MYYDSREAYIYLSTFSSSIKIHNHLFTINFRHPTSSFLSSSLPIDRHAQKVLQLKPDIHSSKCANWQSQKEEGRSESGSCLFCNLGSRVHMQLSGLCCFFAGKNIREKRPISHYLCGEVVRRVSGML